MCTKGISKINIVSYRIVLYCNVPYTLYTLYMCLCIYVLAANYKRLRNYSVWQQSIIIGIMAALYNLVIFWLQHLITDIYFLFDYLWPVASSMVIWPWLFWLLRKVRRQLRLN